MRNKLILLALLLAAVIPAAAQTQTTVTGTLIAPDGTLATNGFVTFKLTPTSATQLFTVISSGTKILAPEISTCNINSSGVLQNSLLTGACLIWGNNLISPAGTAYNITIAPANQTLKVIQGAFINGASVDLSSLTTVTPSVPPPPVPATLLSGTNVFTGANTFSGGLTSTGNTTLQTTSVLSLNNVQFADQFAGADAGAKIAAAIANLPATGGIVDARGLGAVQTWSTNPFAGVPDTKPITLLLGVTTITASVPVIPSSFAQIIGAGGRGDTANITAPGATRIIGKHTGNAVCSLQDRRGIKIQGVNFQGDITTTPKTGLLLGRSLSLASSGNHTFRDVEVSGYFTAAAIYSIASEDNRWYDVQVVLNGGGALYPIFTGQADQLGVDATLGGGSNTDVDWYGLVIVSYVNNPSASLIFIAGGQNTVSHNFFGGQLSGIDGSYVTIQLWLTDNQPTPGPITFVGITGERTSGVLMQNGFNIISPAASSFSGLTVINSRFPTGTGGKFFNQAALATIKDSFIKVPAQTNPSTWQIAQISNTYIDEGAGTNVLQYGSLDLSSGQATFGGATRFINSTVSKQLFSSTDSVTQFRSANQSVLSLMSDKNVGAGDVLGGIYFGRTAGQTDAWLNLVGIQAVAESGPGTVVDASLVFKNHSIEFARFLSSGNLGLGTTTPNDPLQVNGAISLAGSGVNRIQLTGTPTALRTVTLPDVTDTLVARGTTDILTNKTLVAPVLNGVNAQVGTTYTFVAGDEQKLVTFNNAAAVAVTLPAAGTTGFVAGTVFHTKDIGVGTATITPAAGTIDGASSLALATGQGADIYSDGSNYSTQKGSGSAAWSSLSPATAPLTLNNAGFSTEFDQTSPIIWKWKNTTAATSTVAQSSPLLDLSGNFWNGTASAEDLWSAQNIVNSGTNGASTLTFTHSGSTGLAGVQVPNLTVTGEAVLTGGVNPVLDYEPAAFTTSQFFDARPAPWQIIRGTTASPIANGIPSILINQVSTGGFTSGGDASSLNSALKIHHLISGGVTISGASAADFDLQDSVASTTRGTGPAAIHAEAISAIASGDVFGIWVQAFDTGLNSGIAGIEDDVDGTFAGRTDSQTRGMNVIGFPGAGTTAASSGDISNDWGILVQNFGNGIIYDPGLPGFAASTRKFLRVRNTSNATGNANTTILAFEAAQPGPFNIGLDLRNATFTNGALITASSEFISPGKIRRVAGTNNLVGAIGFTAVASASATFTNPYVNPPICVVSPQGNNGAPWVTTTTTTITANFATAQTTNVNYICMEAP